MGQGGSVAAMEGVAAAMEGVAAMEGASPGPTTDMRMGSISSAISGE